MTMETSQIRLMEMETSETSETPQFLLAQSCSGKVNIKAKGPEIEIEIKAGKQEKPDTEKPEKPEKPDTEKPEKSDKPTPGGKESAANEDPDYWSDGEEYLAETDDMDDWDQTVEDIFDVFV